MFTVNVRYVSSAIIGDALARVFPGRANHFTVDINTDRFDELTKEQQFHVLHHELGHVAANYLDLGK